LTERPRVGSYTREAAVAVVALLVLATLSYWGPWRVAEDFPVLTRLARTGQSPAEAKLVFDTTDGKRALSEVWLPEKDGYLVRGNLAEREHQHEIVTGPDSD